MDVSNISDLNQQAVCRAMEYWVAHWDRECATLFGIDLDELKEHLHSFPLRMECAQSNVQNTAVNVLNELLNGASALPRDAVEKTLGISFESAKELIEVLDRE